MFSRRSDWNPAINRLTLAREEHRRRGHELLDLTVSNPTRVGIAYPLDELAEAMADGARSPYDPEPLGLSSAREAVAESLSCNAREVMITASTSEAYSFLFKLLTDPGDAVLTGRPSYPLLDHLAAMELVSLHSYPLDIGPMEIAPNARAIVVVNPNNPTGCYTSLDRVAPFGLPLIVDEVFREYAFGEIPPPAQREDVLTFALGGLSKSAGLPHYKLGWIRVSGPGSEKSLEALELIADNFLSVSTPVQVALPSLLRIGTKIRDAIRARLAENRRLLQTSLPKCATLLPSEGGWSAVVRVPQTQTDEDLALALLDRGVIVHPGYFFDFDRDGHLVLSLLTEPATLSEGIRRIAEAF